MVKGNSTGRREIEQLIPEREQALPEQVDSIAPPTRENHPNRNAGHQEMERLDGQIIWRHHGLSSGLVLPRGVNRLELLPGSILLSNSCGLRAKRSIFFWRSFLSRNPY